VGREKEERKEEGEENEREGEEEGGGRTRGEERFKADRSFPSSLLGRDWGRGWFLIGDVQRLRESVIKSVALDNQTVHHHYREREGGVCTSVHM